MRAAPPVRGPAPPGRTRRRAALRSGGRLQEFLIACPWRPSADNSRPPVELHGEARKGVDRAVKSQKALEHGRQQIEAAAHESLFVQGYFDIEAAAEGAHVAAGCARRAAAALDIENGVDGGARLGRIAEIIELENLAQCFGAAV